MRPPVDIPFPISSFPGANPQEGSGRLINYYAEPLGDPGKRTSPAPQVWRGTPGLSQHNNAATGMSGYRGGLIVNNFSYECFSGEAVKFDSAGTMTTLGAFAGTKMVSLARNLVSNPDVVAVDVDNGAYILNIASVANASATATIAGSVFTSSDTVALTFTNFGVTGFPVTVTHTLGAGESATTIASALVTLITGNATLSAASVGASSAAGVVTVTQSGAIGNATVLSAIITGTGNETVTFNPSSGQLSGGTGTPGINFTGAPLAYNGGGNLPQPNSVAQQDGYFFFTIADGQVFATQLNSLTLNPLTYITISEKADVTLLRGIPFSGVMLFFTTGHCSIWYDAANAAPAFPYARQTMLEYGLVQSAAIAGFETGFSELLWVAQDYGIYWLTAGSLAPVKVSPPDLDRLIKAQVEAGNLLEAGCSIIAGKKFWHISSPGWTWEFNLSTKRWHERWSYNAGSYGRWRAVGGHPAFNKWLVGDTLSGNLLYVDENNYTENGSPMLSRIESGPVKAFPQQLSIARADFDFDMGVGEAVGTFQMTVLGAASGNNGVVRLTVNNTAQVRSGDQGNVSGITGTTEANGTWPLTVIDAYHVELVGSVFKNAYVSGGTVVDVTSEPNAQSPSVAVSCSKDGGVSFDNPSIRSLAPQGKVKRSRASVKNRGQAGPMGVRWRLDITDPVYRGFMGGTMSADPREVRP